MDTAKENIYSNPANLTFFLLKTDSPELSVETIKTICVTNQFGVFELGIIGSSHFFKKKGSFTELLTCSEELFSPELIVQKRYGESDFDFEAGCQNYNYRLNIEFERFSDIAAFKRTEEEIRTQDNSLMHCFEKDSAVTALKYKLNLQSFILKTWHTYPEHAVVVKSETHVTHK